MGDVLDRWRINCGWNPWDDATQDAGIASYVHTLDRYDVPAKLYGELYERVIQLRTSAIIAGKQIPNFGAEIMLACWQGESGLRDELRRREIEERRTLPSVAASQCPRCGGLEAGLEQIYDADGNLQGSRKGCDHRPVVDGEGLWKHLQNMKAADNRYQEQKLLKLVEYKPATDICGEAIRKLGFEVQDAADDVTRGNAHDVWLKMLRIAKYVRENTEE